MSALLLDAGNTRLKWAVIDDAELDHNLLSAPLADSPVWLAQGAVGYDELTTAETAWSRWGRISRCYGVRVSNHDALSRLQQVFSAQSLEVTWLRATARAGQVNNGYQPPESLGADRWAALVAARRRCKHSALVVSAGTALTIDALDGDGHFLGGMIMPGLHSMRHALAQDTALVGMQYGNLTAFPTNTADAVETGVVSACLGAIHAMQSRLQNHVGSAPHIFLTGGDAACLQSFLTGEITMAPGLVLEGVYYLSLEGQTA